MADITKCAGKGCPMRKCCERYTAKPDPRFQSWFAKVPFGNGDCAHFLDNGHVPGEKLSFLAQHIVSPVVVYHDETGRSIDQVDRSY